MDVKIKTHFIFLCLCMSFCNLYPQSDTLSISANEIPVDTVSSVHSPRLATIFSAVLPGLGQAYNKKYWKIPVVYAALGVTGYFYVNNNRQYKDFSQAYKFRTDENPATTDPYVDQYTDDQLKLLRDYYRRNLELTVIAGFAIYALNIIDAAVDAHLYDFEVNDDLSMKIEPTFSLPLNGNLQWGGLKLTLKF
jgi:hypothetical protein